jgi:hypothetical protein
MVYIVLQNAFELSQVIFLLAMHSWYMNRFINRSELLSAYAKPIWEFSSRHLFDLGNPFAAPYRRNLQLRSYPDYARSA